VEAGTGGVWLLALLPVHPPPFAVVMIGRNAVVCLQQQMWSWLCTGPLRSGIGVHQLLSKWVKLACTSCPADPLLTWWNRLAMHSGT
jgi:hypothetical protein